MLLFHGFYQLLIGNLKKHASSAASLILIESNRKVEERNGLRRAREWLNTPDFWPAVALFPGLNIAAFFRRERQGKVGARARCDGTSGAWELGFKGNPTVIRILMCNLHDRCLSPRIIPYLERARSRSVYHYFSSREENGKIQPRDFRLGVKRTGCHKLASRIA